MSLLVGCQGASVPLPMCMNIDIVIAIKTSPTATNEAPKIDTVSTTTIKLLSMVNGTTIRTVKGSINENTCFASKCIDIFAHKLVVN